jgi:DNA-directed RNA polymerase specialized sigma24 family protein
MIAMFQATPESTTEVRSPTLDNSSQLDSFLQSVQNRGFRIAQLATGNQEDALDLVQEAMFKAGGEICQPSRTGMDPAVLSHIEQPY